MSATTPAVKRKPAPYRKLPPPLSPSATVGERARYARKFKGFNYKEISQRMGIKISGVYKFELQKDARTKSCKRMAAALGISLLWLITGEGPMEQPNEEGRQTNAA